MVEFVKLVEILHFLARKDHIKNILSEKSLKNCNINHYMFKVHILLDVISSIYRVSEKGVSILK